MKREDDELERGRKIEEARQLAVSAPILLPLLERQREDAIQKIIGNFRDGNHDDQLGAIAELYTTDGLLEEIRGKIQLLENT